MTRPPACHYDRGLGYRATSEHRDDCPGPDQCPSSRGCAPCAAPHCTTCGREHATNDHPQTCPECLGKIRADLDDLEAAHAELATEATDAGRDGRLIAAARIPGGDAQVLAGPGVPGPAVRYSRTLLEDHPISSRTGRSVDPTPPVTILGQWEAIYRAWSGHTPAGRTTLAGAIAYLRGQLDRIAQTSTAAGGPDFATFTRQLHALRAQLERTLHDEREPEHGVACFECGDKLVRRFHQAKPCRHHTPARRHLELWLRLGYPEGLTSADVRAARQPCGRCDQGGLHDPRAGLSWECPGCRKSYDPGEYATAVRRDLLDNATEGDGWTHITMAAEAATTLTQHQVPAATVRKWMDRGRVTSCCLWEQGRPWGVRLVYWPDVAETALAALERQQRRQAAAREAEQQPA